MKILRLFAVLFALASIAGAKLVTSNTTVEIPTLPGFKYQCAGLGTWNGATVTLQTYVDGAWANIPSAAYTADYQYLHVNSSGSGLRANVTGSGGSTSISVTFAELKTDFVGGGDVTEAELALVENNSVSIPSPRTLTQTGVLPTEMTWKRVGSYRAWKPLDDSHLHFSSAWENGTKGAYYALMDGLSTVHDAALTVSGGKGIVTAGATLELVGASAIPKVPWVAVEMTLDGSTGTGGCGPAIVKDANNYMAFRHDSASNTLKLIEVYGGVTRTATTAAYTPTYPLKLTLVLTGNTISGWVGTAPKAAHAAVAQGDYRVPAIWKNYRYGMAAINATATVSSLRAGPSGVTGAENILPVTHLDGSPYMIDGKLLATADCSVLGRLEGWNTQLWLIDLDNASYQSIGRIYFKQLFGTATRLEGGNYVRLLWDKSAGRWLMTLISFDGWNAIGIGPDNGIDLYGYADIDIRGENIIDTTTWPTLGLSTSGFGYGATVWKSGSTWHLLYSISAAAGNEDDPLLYSDIRPAYYSGQSLNALTLQWRDATAGQCEGGTRMRINGLDYFHWSQNAGYPTYAATSGTSIGNLRNISRYTDVPGYDAAETWAAWVGLATPAGKTKYFALGNTKDAPTGTIATELSTSVDMATVSDTNRGSLAVWKADQESAGREFPVLNAAGATLYPADNFTAGSTTLATGLKLALPLTADASDSSAYTRDLSENGTLTYGANGVSLAAGAAIWCREPSVTATTGNFTYSIAIKYSGARFDGTIFAPTPYVNFQMASTGTPRLDYFNGSAWNSISAPAINDTNSYHILVRYSGGVLSFWKNGVKAGEVTTAVASTVGHLALGASMTYGGYPNTPSFSNTVLGCNLQKAKFWSRALTDAEVAQDYNAGSPWMP